MNSRPNLRILDISHGPVLHLKCAFDQAWASSILEVLLKASHPWRPYTSPAKEGKVTSQKLLNFDAVPLELIEKVRRLIELQWGTSVSLARCFINQAQPLDKTPIHKDLAGSMRGFTAVICLKHDSDSLHLLTFFDDEGYSQGVSAGEGVGDIIVFPAHVLHQQGKGSARSSLVMNFIEQGAPVVDFVKP